MTGVLLRACKVLTLGGTAYRLGAQPDAPGLPYVRQGSESVVYQLVARSHAGQLDRRALKVFSPRFRSDRLEAAADELERLAALPGLEVCRRTVLTPGRHSALLRTSPELTYAVVMPWVDGPTWEEAVLSRQPLSADLTLRLARGMAHVLATMEQQRVAHCDLSGANVVLPGLAREAGAAGGEPVALVDVEGFFGPRLAQPPGLPPASGGYTHPDPGSQRWAPAADRFAGAVLLAEMLGWSDSRVRLSAWGPSFFDPAEMQRDSGRFRLLYWILRELWGADLAQLFQHAWRSGSLQACPRFDEWLPLLLELQSSAASECAPPARHPALVDLPLAAPPAEDGRDSGSRRRKLTLAGLGSLCAAACVLVGAHMWGTLSARPTEPAVESTPAVPVLPATEPTSASAARATLAGGPSTPAAPPAAAMRPSLTSTPSVADAWDAAQVLVDLAWGRDWTTTVDVLDTFLERYPTYAPAREKLYLALVENGRSLIEKGSPERAVAALVRARNLAPGREEAGQVLASLTPTPQPPARVALAEATATPTPGAPTPTAGSSAGVLSGPSAESTPISGPADKQRVTGGVPPTTTQPVASRDAVGPVDTVRSFYRLVQQRPGDQAARLWSPRLRAIFPPQENIVSRFSHTRALVVERADLVALDPTTGRATVAVVLREELDSPPLERRYRGTWDLVRAADGWLLDQPDLRLN